MNPLVQLGVGVWLLAGKRKPESQPNTPRAAGGEVVSVGTAGVPQGGALDSGDWRQSAEAAKVSLLSSPTQAPQPPWVDRADYTAKTSSTVNVPLGANDGAALAQSGARVFAEVRSCTTSGAAGSVAVTLQASQKGVRAFVEAPEGQTISAGSVRFWLFDGALQRWALGGVDESLPTGAQRVVTTDQFVTVGS